MPGVEFLLPRLRGRRFEGGAIPLDVLGDLAGLGEMAIEVAKWCFLKHNPARTRSPKGLADSVAFKLTGLQDGSAIPVISLESAVPTLPEIPPPFLIYFEHAREAIVGAIAAAEQNESVVDYLPEKCLGYFDRIGRGLRAGESIEFTTPSRTGVAQLTRESRRRLVLASSRIKELTAEIRVRGSIPELDQDRMTFELQLAGGRKVTGVVSDQHLDAIMEAFNGYRDATKLLIQGLGKFDRQDRLVHVQSVEHTALLDLLDVPARLDEFRGMQGGWLDGDGVAPQHDQLDWLAVSFDQYYPDELPLPHTFPTPAGGIEMEWTIGVQSVTLEIDLATRQAEWLSYEKDWSENGGHRALPHAPFSWSSISRSDRGDSSQEQTHSLDLATNQGWSWLIDSIGQFSEHQHELA